MKQRNSKFPKSLRAAAGGSHPLIPVSTRASAGCEAIDWTCRTADNLKESYSYL
jgi:hypothetical protein